MITVHLRLGGPKCFVCNVEYTRMYSEACILPDLYYDVGSITSPEMPVLPPDTTQLVLAPREWLTSLAEDVEKWLSKTLGISSKPSSVRALSLLFASGALLYLWCSRLRKYSNEGRPPIYSHWVPWLGSALQIQRDPDALFRRAHRELGSVFGIKSFGSVMYYITDADLINSVYKQTSVFSGSPMQATFLHSVFNMRMEVINGPHAGVFGDMVASKNRCGPPVLDSPPYDLVSELSSGSVKLQDLVILMQKADCTMLLGSSFDFGSIASAFEKFDHGVTLLAINFPSMFMRETTAARSQLIDSLNRYFESGPPEDASQQVKDFVDLAKGAEWTNRDTGSFALGMVWPLLANAPWAVWWLLVYHLHKARGLELLLEEVRRVVNSDRDLLEVVRDSTATPYLDASINETIRIASDSWSVRWVPPSPTPSRLGTFIFRGGDLVMCKMRGVHMDPNVYAHPEVYEPGRFTSGKEGMRGRFFPFGGGFSIVSPRPPSCEGRHLALSQIRAFLIIFLNEFDVSLVDSQSEVPMFSPRNRGFGMIRPVRDVQVRLTRRKL
ncbi:cytochrome P450 domain-containing protein [Rhizoctonia solani AG-1 IA]|uniref:Cytochrome P450 domain-containing protein n=1 Tax=Thanatephorus cucumeris (strain AG1-IA) TaxID=983506 RepID=L8WI62_THACA|nr:cytochrome P450 domain-containing protein [Rhizoctonia solani AG-1 IA]